MNQDTHPRCCSTAVLLAFLLATTAIYSSAEAAFNPSEGAEPASAKASGQLPSIAPLIESGRYHNRASFQPVVFPPLEVSTSPTKPAGALPPLQPVATVAFPVIDAKSLQSGFIAPAPLIAPTAPVPHTVIATQPEVVVQPVIPPLPTVVATTAAMPTMASPESVVPAASTAPLSRDTKAILSHIPSKLDTARPGKGGKFNVNRVTPDLADLQIKNKVDAYEASGIKISVRRPGLDTNYELNKAFTELSGGDSEKAIEVYKNILSTEPKNQDALFGLASLYHRQGQLDKARGYYATLLKNNPNHRDGLNNFLALVSDESPQEALAELVRLEQRNPDFSPIPAQQALVLNKLGYTAEARSKMLRAIELNPDNLTYKYNLAIMLDSQGNYAEASDLYRLLINASNRGETIPASAETLQKRLNFIATAMTIARPAS